LLWVVQEIECRRVVRKLMDFKKRVPSFIDDMRRGTK
jgi:hypothetical protein